jgi:hypothetical protein
LNGVLHRGGQFAVGTAELLEQHVTKPRIWFIDPNGENELFDVMLDCKTSLMRANRAKD